VGNTYEILLEKVGNTYEILFQKMGNTFEIDWGILMKFFLFYWGIVVKFDTPPPKAAGAKPKWRKNKMYYEIKDELFNAFINLEKIDRIIHRPNDNRISLIINGHSTAIICKDETVASRVYKLITDTLTAEKGVVPH
jgi:hypothetical protein